MEKAICADAKLSSLDEKLAETYKAARAALSPEAAKALGAGQSSWLKYTAASCFVDYEGKAVAAGDAVVCLADSYDSRISQLSETGKSVEGLKVFWIVDAAFRVFPDNTTGAIKRSYMQVDDSSPLAGEVNRLLRTGFESRAAITEEDAGVRADMTVSLQEFTPDILAISTASSIDQGGAHPDGGVQYRYFSRRFNRLLTIGDIFSSNEWKGPARQISKEVLQKMQVEPIQDVAVAFDEKQLTDAFGYRFNGRQGFVLEREFLSYAERSEDEIELPWSSFSNLLTPYAKEQIAQAREG